MLISCQPRYSVKLVNNWVSVTHKSQALPFCSVRAFNWHYFTSLARTATIALLSINYCQQLVLLKEYRKSTSDKFIAARVPKALHVRIPPGAPPGPTPEIKGLNAATRRSALANPGRPGDVA